MRREASVDLFACGCLLLGLLWVWALALLGAMVQGCGNADPTKSAAFRTPEAWEVSREPLYDLYVHRSWTPHERFCLKQASRAHQAAWVSARPTTGSLGPWGTTRQNYYHGSIWFHPRGDKFTGAVGRVSYCSGMLDDKSVPYGFQQSQIHLVVDPADQGQTSGYTLQGLTKFIELHQSLQVWNPQWDPGYTHPARWAYINGVDQQATQNAYSAVSFIGGWHP